VGWLRKMYVRYLKEEIMERYVMSYVGQGLKRDGRMLRLNRNCKEIL